MKISEKELRNIIRESIKEIINNSNNSISDSVKFEKVGDSIEFSINDDNKLLCYEDVITYPEWTENALELVELNVVDKRNGYGRALVNALINFANVHKKDVVTYASPLGSHISEDDLIRFYKSCGFEHDDRCREKNCLIYKCK